MVKEYGVFILFLIVALGALFLYGRLSSERYEDNYAFMPDYLFSDDPNYIPNDYLYYHVGNSTYELFSQHHFDPNFMLTYMKNNPTD